jgi:hypothetical protein
MSAGGAAGWSSCEPPAVRMMSTASSTRSLRLSSVGGAAVIQAYLGEPPCLRVGQLAGAAVSRQL